MSGLVAAAFSLRGRATADEPDPSGDPDSSNCEACSGPLPEHLHGVAGEGGLAGRLRLAARYAFIDLFDDLGFWIAFAFVLTGVLSAVLPDDAFALPGRLLPMLAMIAIGVPLYVCASASTPLAALFVAKGASVGTALVFLLVGPGTNAATIGAIARVLGRPFLRIYLGSIVGVALAAGLLLDFVLPDLGRDVRLGTGGEGATLGLAKTAGALVLLALLVWSLRRTGVRTGLRELRDNTVEAWRWLLALRPGPILRSRVTQALVAVWLLSLLASGLVRVPPGAVALHQRFGRLLGDPQPPGAVLALPGIDRVQVVQVDAVRGQPVGYRTVGTSLGRMPVMEESMFVTGDENVIDLHAEAQYRVSDPVAFRLDVEKPDALIASVLRARLVEALAGSAIDEIYTRARSVIEGSLLAGVQHDVAKLGLGVEVLGVRLLDVHAPATVHDAFRDVASAHEDRLTTIHRANEYRVGEVALARGNAERALAGAQAQAAGRVASAQGAAAAFGALAAEHRRAPAALEDRLYLETAERALGGARKIIRPEVGAGRTTELWIRSGDAPITFPQQPAPAGSGPAAGRKP
ncbi:MAG: permease [Deltaproteobacteria bacterium]|nr:permease [Deltaproteobacteria bacterium]